jgi:uncharacterized membrane protein YfcA
MAIGSLFGGYAGAGIARRMGQKNVRILVICLGLVLSLSLFFPGLFPSLFLFLRR